MFYNNVNELIIEKLSEPVLVLCIVLVLMLGT